VPQQRRHGPFRADLAGVGEGGGTVDKGSADNETSDGTDLTSTQGLELDTPDT